MSTLDKQKFNTRNDTKRTFSVDEKFKFNRKKFVSSSFSQGYCMGVFRYRGFGTLTKDEKEHNRKVNDKIALNAKRGDPFSKGVICAMRDCANERKNLYK